MGMRLFSLSETVPIAGAVSATNSAESARVIANTALLPPALFISSATQRGKKKVRMLAEKIVSEKS